MSKEKNKDQNSYHFNEEMTCHDMAELIIDALHDANVIQKRDFKKAVEIAEEELFVRKVMEDESK